MEKKLSKEAYGGVHGKDYVPYINDKSKKGTNLAILIISALAVSAKVFWVMLLYSYGNYYISIVLIAILALMFKFLLISRFRIIQKFLKFGEGFVKMACLL